MKPVAPAGRPAKEAGARTGASSADRVLLVCMPMGIAQAPNLGLSILKAVLQGAGIPCDVRYLNLELLARFTEGEEVIGDYRALIQQPTLTEACASVFAALRFGPDPIRDAMVEQHLAAAAPGDRELVLELRRAFAPFLEYCLESVAWHRYRIVGFTSTFAGMTVPSAVLAGLVKARYPQMVTVLGGANVEDEMGEVIAQRMEEFDYILRGECDETFLEFVRRIFADESPNGIAGLVRRDPVTGGVRASPGAMVRDMDRLPFPDFSDYFATMAAGRFQGAPRNGWAVPFESSRGCWWGEVKHCRFCGINRMAMRFRSKSPARLLDELDHIVERYRPAVLFASDAILDRKYYESLLPTMRSRYPNVHIAYEVKAPVTREQMESLAEASIGHMTIGIESLSTRVLKLMDKGTTYLRNVHCLRLAQELGIVVGWQHLYGFPDERVEDYTAVVAEMPFLHHLLPPLQACPVMLARFSPYFTRARENNIAVLRAHRDYRMSFSWPEEDLSRVAYHFEFEFTDGRTAEVTGEIARLMEAAVAQWQARHPAARLDLHAGHTSSWVLDTRLEPPRIYVLQGYGKSLYDALDNDTPLNRLVDALGQEMGRTDRLMSAVLGFLDEDDAELLLQAEAEAKRLGAEVLRLPDPFDMMLPSDVDEIRAGVVPFLELLHSVGLVARENDHWLALAVPRGRAGHAELPRAVEAAESPALP